jgi:hypothetical protein
MTGAPFRLTAERLATGVSAPTRHLKMIVSLRLRRERNLSAPKHWRSEKRHATRFEEHVPINGKEKISCLEYRRRDETFSLPQRP